VSPDAPPAAPGETPASLVPPYPNLGPEPLTQHWYEGGRPVGVGLILAVVAAFVLMLRAWRKQGRQAAPDGARAGGSEADGTVAAVRDRFIARSTAVRTALVERFGNPWRAKTTEEVAVALGGDGSVDGDLVERLVGFLHLADLAKFGGAQFDGAAGALSAQRGPVDPDGWCAELVAGLAAGARSTISGK
jgi:hypothetical protein